MQQRERALKAVLNLVLDEKRENSETLDRDMLSHRVAIQTAALLWRIFTKDATLRSQMIAIEARIDSGRLNAGNAVLPFASNPLTDCRMLFELRSKVPTTLQHCCRSKIDYL